MPGRKGRSLTEDFIRRFLISIFLIYLMGTFGVLIALFIFMPLIAEIFRELEEPKPAPLPVPPDLPKTGTRELLRNGLVIEPPEELYINKESRIRVGFRNTSRRRFSVEIILDELGAYGDVSPSRLRLSMREGEFKSEFITFIPRKTGRFKADVKVKSGIFLVRIPVEFEVLEPVEGIPSWGRAESGEKYLTPNLQTLFERYEEVEAVGEGGFARVYRARRKDGSVVALKIPYHLTEQAGKVFLKEVMVWSRLKHKNIVELYDANIVPLPYIEMEYCESSLAGLDKPLNWEKAARLIFEVCEGLKYAHSKGIIHRDLKPSNILLKNGTPKISDWGLSKVVTESRSTTGASFTPLYAAPEQISSRFGSTDGRTDIWQLGVLMYELVSGRLPFDGEDFVEVAGKITMEEPERPSRFNPDAKPLEPLIMRCLAKRKEDRYQSVDELQRDLGELLGGRYREELRKSVDFSRSAYYAGQLLLLHMKLGDAKEAYKYALDLKRYAKGEARKELEELIRGLEIRINEGLPVPQELLVNAEVIVHKVSLSPGGL
ncbi:serine/threonine-protein kinase [Thermococcus sp.]